MNIKGLDYNTQRERLVLPEYGREIQLMVDYAIGLPTKAERQRCAETIITTMMRMSPYAKDSADFKQKLWDHLAIMSNFKLDIDYPFDVSQAHQMQAKPAPMKYPMSRIRVRHYGKLVMEACDKLKTMEPGRERNELVRLVANQMKRDLTQWSHGSNDNEKVASDLAQFTDGAIQLDLSTFVFNKVVRENDKPTPKKKKRG